VGELAAGVISQPIVFMVNNNIGTQYAYGIVQKIILLSIPRKETPCHLANY
jgi:hypothetical protein